MLDSVRILTTVDSWKGEKVLDKDNLARASKSVCVALLLVALQLYHDYPHGNMTAD